MRGHKADQPSWFVNVGGTLGYQANGVSPFLPHNFKCQPTVIQPGVQWKTRQRKRLPDKTFSLTIYEGCKKLGLWCLLGWIVFPAFIRSLDVD